MLTEPLTTSEQAAIGTLIAEQERAFLAGQTRSAELLEIGRAHV